MFAFFLSLFQRQRIPLLIHILPHQFLNQLLVLHLGENSSNMSVSRMECSVMAALYDLFSSEPAPFRLSSTSPTLSRSAGVTIGQWLPFRESGCQFLLFGLFPAFSSPPKAVCIPLIFRNILIRSIKSFRFQLLAHGGDGLPGISSR